MSEELRHLIPKSSIFVENIPVGEDEEKALLTVEAYKMSFESSLKKKKLVTLIGAITAGIGVFATLQTTAPLLGVGLLGAGVGTAILAQFMIKPHQIKILSKVYIPTLLVPYKGESLAIVPPYFSERNAPGVVEQTLTFYDANVKTAFRISQELPTAHDSLESEMILQNKLNEIRDSLTPRSKLDFKVVTINRELVEPVFSFLEPTLIDSRPPRSLPFEENKIEENISVVKTLESIHTRVDAELKALINVEKNVKNSVNMFISGLKEMLDKVDKYFSEIRKLLKKNLLGDININAKPTREELEKYGYAYVNHRYHIRLHSKYPITSLIAIFQRHIDETEEKLRSKISEYVLYMKKEIRETQEWTRQRIEDTRDKYKERIGRKKERIKRLKDKIKAQEKELSSIQSQIQSLAAQVEDYESEADRYESQAQWAETASERRSYLSRANRARKEADKLRNKVQRLYEKGMRIKAEYEANLERLEELEEEIEELKNEMETEIEKLKLMGDQKVKKIQEYYTKQIQRVREDLDRFIDIRDEHLSIIDTFYETVIEAELNYQKAPIEHRLKELQDTYSSLLNAISSLRKGHITFMVTIWNLTSKIHVEKPTVVYIPVWAIVSERGEEKLIIPSIVNKGKGSELLNPHPSLKPALEELTKALRQDILREAEKDNPAEVIKEGLKNLDKLVKRGLLTEKEVTKIKKVLGG